MSSPADKGASPDVELAILESDVHHLREQSDRDRRGFAARLSDDRKRLEDIKLELQAQGMQLENVEGTLARIEAKLEQRDAKDLQLRIEIAEAKGRARGASRLIKWLVPAGSVATLVVDHLPQLRHLLP